MKFATLADGSRDGQLLLVSRDLERMLPVLADILGGKSKAERRSLGGNSFQA